MATKRHFIRYNTHSDRIETISVEGRHRPKGNFWTEVDVEHCCGGLTLGYEAARTFKSAVVTAGSSYLVKFFKDGVQIGSATDTVLQEAVDALNASYTGFATFSLTDDNEVQVVSNVAGTFSVTVTVTP